MPVKVSVVVAVYNPGSKINALISSLDKQSLRPDEFEVVFVDDGSTDGTRERLAEAATTRPNVRVTSIPNSGWPGRPRNVGTDLARGEFVFYADHDDQFFPEALERMYAMAVEQGSDIVYGKIVRAGRATPYWPLARGNRANADITLSVASRTVHKLFRREFLHEHGIRFPEGRVRLEDHNFMAQAIPHAKVISILAEYPCYRWVHRPDGTNTSDTEVDRRVYWEYYAGVLRTMEAISGPGPLLDATRVIAIAQAFSRIPPKSYLRLNASEQIANFDPLHELVLEQFRPELDSQLPVLKRMRVQALRSGDPVRFEQLQRCRTKLRIGLRSTRISLEDGRVLISVDATATNTRGAPLSMDQFGDDLVLPAELGATKKAAGTPIVLTPAEKGSGELTIRHRLIGIEWPVESSAHQMPPNSEDKATLTVRVDGTIDPVRSIFGRELDTGIWDVLVRPQFLGESYVRRLPLDADTPLPSGTLQIEGRQVLVYRTDEGTLALKISGSGLPLASGVLTAHWEKDHLVITLDSAASGMDSNLVVRRRHLDSEQVVPVHDGRARVKLGHSSAGDIFDFWVRTVGPEGPKDQRLSFGSATVSQHPPYRVYDTVHGSFSVKHVTALTGPQRTRQPTPAQRLRGWLSGHGEAR